MNNSSISSNSNNSKLLSPNKLNKPSNGSSINTAIKGAPPLHKKKMSNNNVTSNFLDDNSNKKDELSTLSTANQNQDNLNNNNIKDRKRVLSMDIRKKDKLNADNNFFITIKPLDKSMFINMNFNYWRAKNSLIYKMVHKWNKGPKMVKLISYLCIY